VVAKRVLKDPIVITIAVAGILATIGVALLMRSNQQEEATRWLGERAELISRATEDTVAHTFHDLSAVAAYLNSSDAMNQDRFAGFVEQLDLEAGIIGIAYVQIVEHSDLDQYLADIRADSPDYGLLSFDGEGGIGPITLSPAVHYPLRYLSSGPFIDLVVSETPIDNSTEALGFDIATEPLWAPAFEAAVGLSTPSVSAMLDVGGEFEEHAFTVVHPIFADSGELDGMLIAPGLEFLLTTDLGFSITSNVEWSVANPETDVATTNWPVWRRELDLPGSTWALTVSPTDEALSDLSLNRNWVVVVLGLGLTSLLATTVYQIRLRRRKQDEIEQLHRVATDKDRFLAAVSHELRTPLTVVIGLARELADRGHQFDSEEATALVEMIVEHSDEVGAIVEDLLIAARSDIGKVAVARNSVDLGEVVNQAIAGSMWPTVKFAGEPVTAWADPQRVRQILRNLLTNAQRYGGPRVEIRFVSRADAAVVVVADNGIPIEPSQVKHIFDPYTSAHENGEQLGSIGLGLFIALKLARLMDGDIRYHHDGVFSLFELSLPLYKDLSVPSPGVVSVLPLDM
jgi:signal transduction histidine kinase